MTLPVLARRLLDRKGLRPVLELLLNSMAQRKSPSLLRLFYDGGWVHQTEDGFYVAPAPNIRIDLRRLAADVSENFLWGYKPAEGDVILDVGAGVGEELLVFSRLAGRRGKVVCIEAHPRTYRCLEKCLKYNRLSNVLAMQTAVTDKANSSVMIGDSEDYQSNRVGTAGGIIVAATTIDEICSRLHLERVNFLKMNIEGAERFALAGMSSTIRRTDVLCVSCHDFLAEREGVEFLRTKGFVKKFFAEQGLRVVERTGEACQFLNDQIWAYNDELGGGGSGISGQTRAFRNGKAAENRTGQG